MKKIISTHYLSVIFIAGILFITGLNACSKVNQNPCQNQICQNGGTCVNGACNCPPGHSGTNCQHSDFDSFRVEFFCGYGVPSYIQHVKVYMDGVYFTEFTRNDHAPSSTTIPFNFGVRKNAFNDGQLHYFSATEVNTGITWSNMPVTCISTSCGYCWELTPFGTFFNWGPFGVQNPCNKKIIVYQENSYGPSGYELEKNGWLLPDDHVAIGTASSLNCNSPKAFTLYCGLNKLYIRPKGIDSINYPNLRWDTAWFFNNDLGCKYIRLNHDGTMDFL